MSSSNPFGLLDDPVSNEGVETSVISTVINPVATMSNKPTNETAAPKWKRQNNSSHSEVPKTTPTKTPQSSEHAPARLVYSREWLLSCHKNYAAPSGFNGNSAAFHDLSQLPVALLPNSHEVMSFFSFPIHSLRLCL
jgi:hypothetical protein